MKGNTALMCLVYHKPKHVVSRVFISFTRDVFAPWFVVRLIKCVGHASYLHEHGVDIVLFEEVHIGHITSLLSIGVVVTAGPIQSPHGGHPYATQFFLGQKGLGSGFGLAVVVVVMTSHNQDGAQCQSYFFPGFHIPNV